MALSRLMGSECRRRSIIERAPWPPPSAPRWRRAEAGCGPPPGGGGRRAAWVSGGEGVRPRGCQAARVSGRNDGDLTDAQVLDRGGDGRGVADEDGEQVLRGEGTDHRGGGLDGAGLGEAAVQLGLVVVGKALLDLVGQ